MSNKQPIAPMNQGLAMPDITIRTAPINRPDKEYIYAEMFRNRLGLEYSLQWEDIPHTQIVLNGKYSLVFPDTLLNADDVVARAQALTSSRHYHWFSAPEGLDIPDALWKNGKLLFFSESDSGTIYAKQDNEHFQFQADLFGSAFFFLNACEEYFRTDVDQHGRLGARGSLADFEGILDIPIVDVYELILRRVLEFCGITSPLLRPAQRARITCDIDVPYTSFKGNLPSLMRNLGGDILMRRSPSTALRRLLNHPAAARGQVERELNHTYGWIMDRCEEHDLQATFFFMASEESIYHLDEPWVGDLFQSIQQRGHRWGIHPDLGTCTDGGKMAQEVQQLRRSLERHGCSGEIGGRQHYLQTRTPATLRLYEKNGLAFDSTLGFHDRVGFRTGTSKDYKIFDVREKRTIDVICEPLHLMEVSVLDYMQEPLNSIPTHTRELKEKVDLVGGTLNILWHNNMIVSPRQRAVYGQMIDLL
jgi:hypothetical protein